MASGLILGILFMRYQKWYPAAAAAGILFGIIWNYGTIGSVTAERKTVWQMPERGDTRSFV